MRKKVDGKSQILKNATSIFLFHMYLLLNTAILILKLNYIQFKLLFFSIGSITLNKPL